MKVLFTTPILEHPAAGGPQLRIENSIKTLNKVCELHVMSRASKAMMGGSVAEDFYREESSCFSYSPSASPSFKDRCLRKLRLLRNDDADVIINYVDHYGIDIVWFGYGNISYKLIEDVKNKRPDIKVVCDTDSVWSRFILRELPLESEPKRRAEIEQRGREKEVEEKAWVNLCEVTTAVSEVDAVYYREIAKDPKRVKLFSNVIDLKTYDNLPSPPIDLKKPCIYLAGTFGHINSPMDRAARWVLDEIFPKVKLEIPGIHFYIVGRGTEATLGNVRDENVTVTGKLPSVLPYLCHADVALVPLKFESGTRFKILEAGACNIPIVSTTLGAEGIPVKDGRDIVIADEADKFAEAIINVIRDGKLSTTLAKNCKQLIQNYFSVETLIEEADAILKFLSR